ncbi:serine/arginine repetitive matrix protein 2-like [Asterias rubens]|uniref:serine/arginine repetitive matrix protein 2-like n=1 Tax=Asterias rubens TaxID=7604 RepID=UPI001455641C|nr:serine/arginine repetitive matrix protein 2-like [Asterias rubens]
MSAFSDREATLSRLSKLQREIEQLTDTLNRKPNSKAKSSSYDDSNRSSSRASSRRVVLPGRSSNLVTEPKGFSARTPLQPSPSYASRLQEIEARYATSGLEHNIKPVFATAQIVSSLIPSGQPIGGKSWTSAHPTTNTGQFLNVAGSSKSSFSFQPVSSLLPSGQPIKSSRGSHVWKSHHRSANTTQLLNVAGSHSSSFLLEPARHSTKRDRNTSQQHTSKSSHRSQVVTSYSRDLSKKSKLLLNNQVKKVEEKYLVRPNLPIMQEQRKHVLHSSSTLPNDPSRVKLSSRKVISPSASTSKQLSKDSSRVQSTSSLPSSGSDRKSSKYSWRQPSHTKHSQDESRKLPSSGVKKSPFKYEKSQSSGSRDSSRTSTGSRSSSRDANRSKYHYDSRSTSESSAHRKRRHSGDHHTHSSPYSTSKYKLTARPSSSRSNTSSSGSVQKHYSTDKRHDTSPVHRSSSNSRVTSKSSHVYIRGRGQNYLSSRNHSLQTRRGHGFVTFRGHGSRGRGYARGAGVYRGQSAPGYSPRTKQVWGSSYSPRYRGKGRSSRHNFTRPSPKKHSPGEGFRSKYALMKTSLAQNTLKKPLSFMEKRRLTVLNDTPVLLRSRYRLVKGHRSVLRPAFSSASLVTPLRKLPTVKRLVTVKITKTKLIRRVAGEKMSSGSMVNLRGAQFKLRINRFSKALYRLPSNASQVSPSNVRRLVLKSATPSVTRKVASHVLQRSINISLAAKHRSKKQSNTKQYCMFYNLYGRCKRGNDCPYIHDPEKVAVCTRFLRGTCPKTDGSCLFSHKVSKEKMPVCSYFLRGVCNRDDCPYSHVKVSNKATPCPDFIKGYCPLGEKCKKKHIVRCPDFTLTGKCANGAKCPLLHKRDPTKSNNVKTKTRKSSTQDSETEKVRTSDRTPTAKHKKRETSFIKLSSDTPSNKTAPSTPDTSEKGNSFQRNTSERQQITSSGEGASIIPSFVKLLNADRNKSIAPSVAKTAVSDREPAIIPRLRTKSNTSLPPQENGMIQSTSRKLRSDTLPCGGESSKSSKGLASVVPKASADHHHLVETAPSLPKDEDSSFIDLNVTPPSLSAAGEGSEELPSFIELYPGSPFSPMEESTNTAQQEAAVTRTLQIRPQFKRLFKSEKTDSTKKTDTTDNR